MWGILVDYKLKSSYGTGRVYIQTSGGSQITNNNFRLNLVGYGIMWLSLVQGILGSCMRQDGENDLISETHRRPMETG